MESYMISPHIRAFTIIILDEPWTLIEITVPC